MISWSLGKDFELFHNKFWSFRQGFTAFQVPAAQNFPLLIAPTGRQRHMTFPAFFANFAYFLLALRGGGNLIFE